MSDSDASHIATLEIEQWKLWINSNCHNFSVGCPIQAHHVSIAQNWTTIALENSNGHNFSVVYLIQAHHISRHCKLNNGSSREIQKVITFHSDVRFRCITYRDAKNWTTEALKKFKWHNFLECITYREIQMVITFHSDVQIRRIIYRDARNCTKESLEKFYWS